MFEKIIEQLIALKTPATRKLKIPVAGTRAFELILKSDVPNETIAVELAVNEFAEYSKGDPQVVSDFKKILDREFSGLNSTKLIKKKARALKEIWEIEARTLAAKNKRNKWLSIRVTEEEYEMISKQAQEEGLDISNYIRKRLGLEYKL
ncbi:plasmid mobilization protein [Thermococcus sp.]